MKMIREPHPGVALEGMGEIERTFRAVKRDPNNGATKHFPMRLVSGFKATTEKLAQQISGPEYVERHADYAHTGFIVLMNQAQTTIAIQAVHRLADELVGDSLDPQHYRNLEANMQQHLDGEGEEFDKDALIAADGFTVLFDLVEFEPITQGFGIEVL